MLFGMVIGGSVRSFDVVHRGTIRLSLPKVFTTFVPENLKAYEFLLYGWITSLSIPRHGPSTIHRSTELTLLLKKFLVGASTLSSMSTMTLSGSLTWQRRAQTMRLLRRKSSQSKRRLERH